MPDLHMLTCAFCSELQKLHKELVFGKVLTESEFWASRKVVKLLRIH